MGDGPHTILSQKAQEKLDEIQRGGGWKGTAAQLASTLGTDLGTAGAIMGGLVRGAQAGIAQTGAEVGAPILGRDVAGMVEAFPTGDMGGGTLLDAPGGAVRSAQGAREAAVAATERADLAASPLSDAFRAQPVAPEAVSKIEQLHPGTSPPPATGGAPGEPGVAPAGTPGSTAPEPNPTGWRPKAKDEPLAPGMEVATNPDTGQQFVRDSSAGAQVTNPRNVPAMTPDERAVYEQKSVQQTHIDRSGPSRVNGEVYFDGVKPTLGAVDPYGKTADGQLNAVAEKTLSATDPDFKEKLDRQNSENNDIRKDGFMDEAQDLNAIQAQEDIRQQHFDDNTAAALTRSAPVDPAAARATVEDAIDSVLQGPAGKRGAVRTTLESVRDRFFRDRLPSDPPDMPEWDRIETDPEILNGVRAHINDLLSSTGQKEGANRLASRQLERVREAVDDLISTTSPGYQAVREQWRADSIPIDQMSELQKYLTGGGKITDPQGFLQFGKVQRMLEKIVTDRQKRGINNAKSLTDQQMNMIISLRDDLARDNYKDYIGRTKGSDTTQQLTAAQHMFGAAKKYGLETGLHVLALKVAPGLGNVAVRLVTPAMKARSEARAAAQTKTARDALSKRLLSSHPQWVGPTY